MIQYKFNDELNFNEIDSQLDYYNKDTKRKKIIYLNKWILEKETLIQDFKECLNNKTKIINYLGLCFHSSVIKLAEIDLQYLKLYLIKLKEDKDIHVLISKENSQGKQILYFEKCENLELSNVYAFFDNSILNTQFFDTTDFYKGSDYEPILTGKKLMLSYETINN